MKSTEEISSLHEVKMEELEQLIIDDQCGYSDDDCIRRRERQRDVYLKVKELQELGMCIFFHKGESHRRPTEFEFLVSEHEAGWLMLEHGTCQHDHDKMSNRQTRRMRTKICRQGEAD